MVEGASIDLPFVIQDHKSILKNMNESSMRENSRYYSNSKNDKSNKVGMVSKKDLFTLL
jgi:hypothetical protein